MFQLQPAVTSLMPRFQYEHKRVGQATQFERYAKPAFMNVIKLWRVTSVAKLLTLQPGSGDSSSRLSHKVFPIQDSYVTSPVSLPLLGNN